MRILQINDLHIAKEGEDSYGVDVRQNFLNMVERLRSIQADLLVINGDLCYRDGELEIYEWIKSQLKGISTSVAFTSGNHDDPEMMADVFDLGTHIHKGELYYRLTVNHKTCLFLDTTTRNVSPTQLQWLKEELKSAEGSIFVFMHHPPILAGVPFMDNNHALINREEIQDIFKSYQDSVYVFSGHYHVDKIVHHQNMTVFITPACFFQIDQNDENFKVDHYRIGFRDIIWENCALQSAVHYI